MLNFRDLGLEGIERLCQADLAWEFIPLYYCPVKEGKACIVFVSSQLAILMVSSTSTPLQILILINGNIVFPLATFTMAQRHALFPSAMPFF